MGLEVVGDGLSTASVLAGGGYWWMAACQWARAIGDVGNSFRGSIGAEGGWMGVFHGAWPPAAMAGRRGGVLARVGPGGWA